jgi:hypothetical protein
MLACLAMTAAVAVPVPDWRAMGAPPQGTVTTVPADTAVPLAPGLTVVDGPLRLRILATVVQDSGPADHGLEAAACLPSGRRFESLLALASDDAAALVAAGAALWSLPEGAGSAEGDPIPARGTPMRVRLRWHDDGALYRIDLSCLVRERADDRQWPPLPFLWTGSATTAVRLPDPAGGVRTIDAPALALSRVAIAIEDAEGALLASPMPPSPGAAGREVDSSRVPFAGTAVAIEIAPAVLPMALDLGADGTLFDPGGTEPLAPVAVRDRLRAAFAAPDPERLAAVAVTPRPDTPRHRDAEARLALIAHAAAAGVWAMPVFTPPRATDRSPE